MRLIHLSDLHPETGTDAQRVYLFRGCAGDSRKAA